MRTRATAAIALLAGLAAVTGCGGEEKGRAIPAETRQELQKQLTSIENRFEAAGGACADITENQASVKATLDGLPADIDADVRDTLSDGFARLFDLTSEQCDEQKGQETETEAETTPEPPPVTTTDEAPPPVETQPEAQPEEDGAGKGKEKEKGNGGANNGGGVPVPGGDGSGGATPGDG